MEEIIKAIHAQWQIAKEQHRARCEAAHFTDVAEKLAACDMFKGTEDLQELMRLLTSPQGTEFCIANNFPNLTTFCLFRKEHLERFGVYIDAGEITLTNPDMAFLVGRTNAIIHCNTLKRHKVVAMHGASATVMASKWAVVHAVSGAGSNIIRRISDNAVIL